MSPQVAPADLPKATRTPRLQVYLNHIDHTLIPPGPLDNSSLYRVPVLRIFGLSSAGQQTCVHVHQVYPYFYIAYPGKLSTSYVKRYISRLTLSLNHAIALSLNHDPRLSTSQYIRAIILVKGVDFYGFHTSYSPFLKILVANPAYVNRIAIIMRSGMVMSTRFRLYESHLSFVLQFMCDFGLYGCGLVEFEDALERCEEEPVVPIEGDPPPMAFAPSPYFRQSRLPLEVDVISPQILNRLRIDARYIHHQLNIPAPRFPSDPLVLSVRELWDDERARRQARGLHPSPEMPIDPSDSSRAPGGAWVAEARWWDAMRKRIEEDAQHTHREPITTALSWESGTITTFESVEALWEEHWKNWKPTSEQYNEEEATTEENDQIDVDMSMLSKQEIGDLEVEEANESDRNNRHFEEHQDEDEIEEDNAEGENLEENCDPIEAAARHVDVTGGSQDPFVVSDEAGDNLPNDFKYRLPSPPDPEKNGRRKSRDATITPTKRTPSESDSHNLLHPASPSPSVHDLPLQPVWASSSLPNFPDQLPQQVNLPVLSERTEEDDLVAKKRTILVAARAIKPSHVFNTCMATNLNRYVYSLQPPSSHDLLASLEGLGIDNRIYRSPYYSKDSDIPDNPKEYAGLQYHLKGGEGIVSLDEWDHAEMLAVFPQTMRLDPAGIGGWEYARHPPSIKEVRKWIVSDEGRSHTKSRKLHSQIEGPTQANIYGFKTSPTTTSDNFRERKNMSVLSLELFVPTSEDKAPAPETDEIFAVFYAHHVSGTDIVQSGTVVRQTPKLDSNRLRYLHLDVVSTELELLNRVVDIVVDIDPDILVGWEVQRSSWGYAEARGKQYGFSFPIVNKKTIDFSMEGFEIADLISRAVTKRSGGGGDRWSLRTSSTFKVTGRHVLNLWRVMRSEQTLNIYSFENVAFHLLRRRVPKYSYKTLTEWYHSPVPAHAALLIRHLTLRTRMMLEILEESELVTKTAEFARVFGVDFFSVISRGSQFKVESFMFRIAKPECFVLISPNKSDVGKQNAAECMPLIMEPISAFYSSPLVVLDFQSLYPSVMIAYNYCYSTCLGRITDFQGKFKFGVVDFDLPPGMLANLENYITVAPNGIMYVKSDVRRGLLGRMLAELLETRVMVKQAMKGVKDDKSLRRILDARQLGLKYIANVTYGYTSATFSGRMPAVEIADSIVQSGRETLEKAIDLIHNTKRWGAQVVYGDTDSVFLYLKGKTKEQAFRIGHEIADAVTSLNPSPIKLKFEKVYLPSVLMAKKRYVGFKYEQPDDKNPTFDAKGIETVRRDGVPAQRKMTENCLKILFRTQDLSEVKDYCYRSWAKLLDNKASVQDLIFAKEVRMGTYSDKVPPPPGVVVAARRMTEDANAEPAYGERVPYVIVQGPPGSRLVDRALDPLELLNNSDLRLDATYYITRVLIPPLERIFNLVGADVKQWFTEMPRMTTTQECLLSPRKFDEAEESPKAPNIDVHFQNEQCLVCGEWASQGLCDNCWYSNERTIANLAFRIRSKEKRLVNIHRICRSCTGSAGTEPIKCESLDCPWFYSRRRAEEKMELVPIYQEYSAAVEEDLDLEMGPNELDTDVDMDAESETETETETVMGAYEAGEEGGEW